MSKIEYHNNDGHVVTLSLDQHAGLYEVAETLRLLVQAMSFTHEQAHEILPDEQDVEKFVDELSEAWDVHRI